MTPDEEPRYLAGIDLSLCIARDEAIRELGLYAWPIKRHRHGWRCVRCFLIGHAALSGPCPRCPHRVD